MVQINICEAEHDLLALIKFLENNVNNEIILEHNGDPVAKIIPFKDKPIKNKTSFLGAGKGQYKIPSENELERMDMSYLL